MNGKNGIDKIKKNKQTQIQRENNNKQNERNNKIMHATIAFRKCISISIIKCNTDLANKTM